MDIKSVKFRGHKCFKKEWAGFDELKPINIIIGRNNTGKSRLLDLVEAICDNTIHKRHWDLRVAGLFTEEGLKKKFSPGSYGGEFHSDHWTHHGKYFIGAKAVVEFDKTSENSVTLEDEFLYSVGLGSGPIADKEIKVRKILLNSTANDTPLPLKGHIFKRLSAERNIQMEINNKNLLLGADGHGATNIIRRYLNSSNTTLSRSLIIDDLLAGLNIIFGPEGFFTEILTRVHDDPQEVDQSQDHFEIFLAQKHKGPVALSRSGSGLKTVLLVLLNLLIVPDFEKKEKNRYVFAFEELETHLHPSLLRRLLTYIENYVKTNGAMVFLTTHSSIALDLFSGSSNSQIILVQNDGDFSTTTTINADLSRVGIISELGAKPSDLLQANCVIWVEGPSDRIYINKWLELFSDGELKEGRHYACACYGGALLARTQFAHDEDASKDFINLLKLNNKVVVVCDSDRTAASGEQFKLKARVERIRAEIEKTRTNQIWITDGKEIENYLPEEVLKKAFSINSIRAPNQFERFFPPEKGKSFLGTVLNRKGIDKVELAALCTPHFTKENMRNRFNLEQTMANLIKAIKDWNV